MREHPVNILVTSAGGAAAINVMRALRTQADIPVRIVGVDVDPLAPGLHLSDAMHIVPRSSDTKFMPAIMEICELENVDVVIPMLSGEVPIFTIWQEKICNMGVAMVVSGRYSSFLCNDKCRATQLFAKIGIPIPETWAYGKLPFDRLQGIRNVRYPVIVKPAVGSGSRNIYVANNLSQLNGALEFVDHPIVQQFVRGTEITVDVLADRDSNALAAVQRERLRVSDGKAVVSRTMWDAEIDAYTRQIVREFEIAGPCNIQCIKNDDGLFFTEIHDRFSAGGLPLTVSAGANTPLMLLKMALGLPVYPATSYRIGLVMSRYLSEMFLEHDIGGQYVIAENICDE